MTELSPAAQACVTAFQKIDFESGHFTCEDIWVISREVAAAVLRAAADQVVPEEPLHGGDQRWMYERDARQSSRRKLLAIAAELEANL